VAQLAWLNRCRRLTKDWENLNRTAHLSSNDVLTFAAMALQSAIAVRIRAFGFDDARTKSSLEKMIAFGKAALPGSNDVVRMTADGKGIRDLGSKFYAQVTNFALDALGRTEEAKALREKYGLTQEEEPRPHEQSRAGH
jgi:hypothetical protein